MTGLFDFPNPVNEVAARLVAGGVLAMSVVYLLTGHPVVLAVLAYGFLARVATGPTLSPLGRLATAVAPRIAAVRPVPGPPKRFAQGIGATLTAAATLSHLFGGGVLAAALVGAVAVAATLEAVLAVCLGCHLFAALMRAGMIPDEVCESCSDLRLRDEVAA